MSIAEDMTSGHCCAACGDYFIEEHGFPVLCRDCFRYSTKKERAGIPKATIPTFDRATDEQKRAAGWVEKPRA